MAAISSCAKCIFKSYKVGVCFSNKNIYRRLSFLPGILQNNDQRSLYSGYIATKQRLLKPAPFHSTPITYQKIVPFNLSDIGEGIREVSVKEWFVKVGDSVAQFDKICEVQSDKASVTITSRYDGVIMKLYHEVDDIGLVGEPLVDIMLAEEGTGEESSSSSSDSSGDSDGPTPVPVELADKRLATPAVRHMASQNQVILSNVKGSGKHGRVLKEDIIKYLKKDNVPASPALSIAKLPTVSAGVDRAHPVSGYVKAMVKTMTEAKKIPHLTYSDEIKMSELVKLCTRLRQSLQTKGVKITYMPFFIKATSNALKQFPIVNSSVDANCENIIYKASHNIGIAMDTPDGLIVPNVKHVQDLSIYQIATELHRLQALGVQRGLGINDLTGGTITLSNIGAIGGTYCVPVILPPEVAIAALGKVQTLPRYDELDNVCKTQILNISWSADHRVVDGATIARFSNLWKEYIENPDLLLLGM